MKRIVAISALLVAGSLTVFLALGLKRVSPAQQGLRIGRGGHTRTYPSGIHFVAPFSGDFLVYPAGTVEVRCPRDGAYSVTTDANQAVQVAVVLRMEFPSGEPERIYRVLGRDATGRIAAFAKDAVDSGVAKLTGTGAGQRRDALGRAIIRGVQESLTDAGVRVMAIRFETFDLGGPREPAQVANVFPEPLRRVVFVGVDGADWEIIRPLMAEGRLPNWRRLVEGGASGTLRSIEPLLSPLLWTTMATGKLPEEHGILNFTVADPETGKKVPISRLYRRVDAFWNMLGDYGRRVDIVGWLATFPAEEINGVMVTDRVGYLAYAEADDRLLEGSISPAERAGEMSQLVVKSGSVAYEEFEKFIHADRSTFQRNRSIPFDPKNSINNMIMLYASTETYRRMAMHLLARDRPDFLGVYFELVDATKHLFMHYAPPRMPVAEDAAFALFKDAVAAAYQHQDLIIGELIDELDDRDVLIVASDHGFKSGASRPQQRPEIWAGRAAFWHRVDGVICIYGDGIRKDHTIEGATILDITPTFLALQGLPKPDDMPGKVLEEAFEPELAEGLNRERIPTLQREREPPDVSSITGNAADEEALKKLEALGYITRDNPDAHNNLGQRLKEQGRFEEAIEEFKKALAINPNFPAALNNMGVCYGSLRRFPEAEEAFRTALRLNPQDVHAMNNLAILHMQLGRFEDALRFAEQSLSVEPTYANGRLTLGSIYANMGNVEAAEAEFEKVLEIDPSNRNAQMNLQRLRSSPRSN